MNNVIPLKPTTDLELILLPPEEKEEVSKEDIKYFYKNLTNILKEYRNGN